MRAFRRGTQPQFPKPRSRRPRDAAFGRSGRSMILASLRGGFAVALCFPRSEPEFSQCNLASQAKAHLEVRPARPAQLERAVTVFAQLLPQRWRARDARQRG